MQSIESTVAIEQYSSIPEASGSLWGKLRRTLVGSPIPTHAESHHRLSKTKALAVFSSDALSSVAYATDEILLALALGGAGALHVAWPIAVVIVMLICIVSVSYYQTVHAYPQGGGSFTVAQENLGELPGLTAAAALLVDYVLTVAVSISAGVLAIVSACPSMADHSVGLCIIFILAITWANVRGLRESASLFSVGTYGFVGIFVVLILSGLVRSAFGLLPVPAAAVHVQAGALSSVGIVLVLRAFSSGCTALTGIEAIADGVPAFRKPEADNAGKTLIAMALILGGMFLGSAYLATELHLVPREGESIASQLGRIVFGTGPLYYMLQAATALILVLAANTAFADFPRLSSILAREGYLPRQLSLVGDRLVFSNGIFVLALTAILLVILFEGDTHRLIPLYAVGVFISFTLSQAGMVRRWCRSRSAGWLWKAAINGVGAVTTGIVLIVLLESKLRDGAWIVVLLIPIVIWCFLQIKAHYRLFLRQVSIKRTITPQHVSAHAIERKVVLPLSRLNEAALEALRFARSISRDVRPVVVDVLPGSSEALRREWEELGVDLPLTVLASPYRSVARPLLHFVRQVDREDPERGLAVVVLPEIVPARWWQHFLHNQTALFLRAGLRYGRSKTRDVRIIIQVPFQLRR